MSEPAPEVPAPTASLVATLPTSTVTAFVGDSLRILKTLPENSIDAVVCDPPYAIRAVSDPAQRHRELAPRAQCRSCEDEPASRGYDICLECIAELRVSAFADAAMLGQQSANWHEKATHSRGYADNDNSTFGLWVSLWAAECLRLLKPGGHLIAFGGTRTWHRLACSVEGAGFEMRDSLAWLYATGVPKSLDVGRAVRTHIDPAATGGTVGPRGNRGPVADQDGPTGYAGWFTGLKPAHEPIVLARKPVEGTVAENVLRYGTGAMNVGATRLPDGRWPTNVLLDSDQADRLDRALGERGSRFFFVAKPNPRERVSVNGVEHPTVKPLSLMRELVRLVTPAGGIVLDPFAGSGTTVEACVLEERGCLAVERDPDYLPLIRARIERRTLRATAPADYLTDGTGVPLSDAASAGAWAASSGDAPDTLF